MIQIETVRQWVGRQCKNWLYTPLKIDLELHEKYCSKNKICMLTNKIQPFNVICSKLVQKFQRCTLSYPILIIDNVPLTFTLSSPGMWLNNINMRSKARIEIMVELEARSSVVVSTWTSRLLTLITGWNHKTMLKSLICPLFCHLFGFLFFPNQIDLMLIVYD